MISCFLTLVRSIGAINRAVLLACDYFVSPMSVDIFSLRAIENISISLENWSKLLRRGLEDNPEPEEIPIDFMIGACGSQVTLPSNTSQSETPKARLG